MKCKEIVKNVTYYVRSSVKCRNKILYNSENSYFS